MYREAEEAWQAWRCSTILIFQTWLSVNAPNNDGAPGSYLSRVCVLLYLRMLESWRWKPPSGLSSCCPGPEVSWAFSASCPSGAAGSSSWAEAAGVVAAWPSRWPSARLGLCTPRSPRSWLASPGTRTVLHRSCWLWRSEACVRYRCPELSPSARGDQETSRLKVECDRTTEVESQICWSVCKIFILKGKILWVFYGWKNLHHLFIHQQKSCCSFDRCGSDVLLSLETWLEECVTSPHPGTTWNTHDVITRTVCLLFMGKKPMFMTSISSSSCLKFFDLPSSTPVFQVVWAGDQRHVAITPLRANADSERTGEGSVLLVIWGMLRTWTWTFCCPVCLPGGPHYI